MIVDDNRDDCNPDAKDNFRRVAPHRFAEIWPEIQEFSWSQELMGLHVQWGLRLTTRCDGGNLALPSCLAVLRTCIGLMIGTQKNVFDILQL